MQVAVCERNNTIDPVSTSQERVCCANQKLSRKTGELALGFFKNPFWLVTAGGGVLAAFSISVLIGAISIPKVALAAIAATAVIGLNILMKKYKYEILHELSLLCIRIESAASRLKIYSHEWYNEIKFSATSEPVGKLYLGAIPLASKSHHKKILNLSPDRSFGVLSVVKPFENQARSVFGDPVRPKDWRTLGVSHKQLEVFDYCPVPVDKLEEGADFIHQQLQNRNVYVHCKAGRGRSTSTIVAYVLKYRREEAERKEGSDIVQKAINLIRESRPLIRLNAKQVQNLYEFARRVENSRVEAAA